MNRDIAGYSEIMQHWDINEVMTANEWLDIRDDQEWLAGLQAEADSRARNGK